MDSKVYRKLLWVCSTSNLINIPFNISTTDKLDATVLCLDTRVDRQIGLNYTTINHDSLMIQFNANNMLRFYISGINKYYNVDLSKPLRIVCDDFSNGEYYLNGSLITTVPYIGKDFVGNINSNISNISNANILFYDYHIKDSNGASKYHFIPVMRIADNKVGLYDDVNDKFYVINNASYSELPTNFANVTAIQIPEGNVIKIEDKEGEVLWANINKLAYGVRWNSVSQATTACERIGNLELHKTLPIQSRFKVCIHQGKEIQYYCNPDDSRFVDFDNDNNKDEINDVVFNINDRDVLNSIFWFGNYSQGAKSLDDESTNNYYMVVTDARFLDYRWLYAYVKITASDKNIYIGRIIEIDVSTKQATIELSQDLDNVQPFTNIELGCSINGYDGEIGVDTGGKFYQWSVDNAGVGNEVWQSLYKCVTYAREIKRHIIGIDRACVLNTAFNDDKWGWIGTLPSNTAVDVINYHVNVRGGYNSPTYDNQLGIDNFRCQLGKARTNIPLDTMRQYSQKTDGGQMLYKQIWEAIVWSYIIEYANFDVKKGFNSNLTSEGYHQGGLGNGVVDKNQLNMYNNNQKNVPNDYTLQLGNHTGIKTRASRVFTYTSNNNTKWNNWNKNRCTNTLSADNSEMTVTSINTFYDDWHVYTEFENVGGTHKYKIEGLTDGQYVVFHRESGKLVITTDGTYDVNWGSNLNYRFINFGKVQKSCNIKITILSSPAYNYNLNQSSFNVPHWRGFNIFWYGDIWINVDNMLTKYDNTKQKVIWYYTDDIAKFDNNIDNKEHQTEGLGKVTDVWLQEIAINNKGDIVPSKVNASASYKNNYHRSYTDTNIHTTFVGGRAYNSSYCGLLCLFVLNDVGWDDVFDGFVKTTILDN